jgi:hypothetical protein
VELYETLLEYERTRGFPDALIERTDIVRFYLRLTLGADRKAQHVNRLVRRLGQPPARRPGAPLPVPASPTAGPAAAATPRRWARAGRVEEGVARWHGASVFEPAEFREKLAALTPRPEVHVLLYPGVLAPHARWRRQSVGVRRAAASEEAAARRAERGASRGPRCGGRLRLIATVEDPAVVGTILAPLGLLHPADSPGPAPARSEKP